MNTYNFYDLSGRFLETIKTDNPANEIGELSHFHNVDADEIEWVQECETQEA